MAARKTVLGVPSSLQDWIIDNVQLGKQIGRGANGRILEAKWEGTEVAVKEIHSIFINQVSEPEFQTFKQSFLRECEQCSRLRHPNIVRIFGIYLPPGARVPSLVMERLHCSLTNLLEQTAVIPIEKKLKILYDVSLGVRYLHSRTPPIIHRDLSSNNVLLSKALEAKIGDLGTIRLVDPVKQSKMTLAPGTIHFMPPEALVANPQGVRYGRELDVFSFGCVMLHTLSNQWPIPSEPVVTDPVTFEMKARSEIERRRSYFDGIDRSRLAVLISLIENCLSNLPKNRTSIVTLCEQLEGMVDKENTSDLQQQTFQLNETENKVDTPVSEMSKLRFSSLPHSPTQLQPVTPADSSGRKMGRGLLKRLIEWSKTKIGKTSPSYMQKQVNTKNNLKLTWQKCTDVPGKLWATSAAELNGKVYITARSSEGAYCDPFGYNHHEESWFSLPELPVIRFSLTAAPNRKHLLSIGGVDDNGKVTNKVFLWDESYDEWLTPYPDMPTARYYSSCISHGSSVIVAGGLTGWNPLARTRSVEILHISETDSHWSIVEQLPHVTQEAIPIIVNDNLYIAGGFDEDHESTCNVVTASLSELLRSDNSNINSGQVWKKLPDMPYSSLSINHYQGQLITFTGDRLVEQTDEDKSAWSLVPLIYIYNPGTKSWDCIGESPLGYLIGYSVHLEENKIFFVGGLTGTHISGKEDDIVTTCMLLTFAPQL